MSGFSIKKKGPAVCFVILKPEADSDFYVENSYEMEATWACVQESSGFLAPRYKF